MSEIEKQPEQIEMAGGLALSTKVPSYHLIPRTALDSLANRLDLGIKRKGKKSWNALSENYTQVLDNKEFAIERCGHIMRHAALLIEKLQNNDIEGMIADDDAGAILWGGTFMACVTDRMIKQHSIAGTADDQQQ